MYLIARGPIINSPVYKAAQHTYTHTYTQMKHNDASLHAN